MAGPWEAFAVAPTAKPWENYAAPAANDAAPPQLRPGQREGSGVWDSVVANVQSSASGLLYRGRLPDVVLNPHHQKWYEEALGGLAGAAADLPGGIAGGAVAGGLTMLATRSPKAGLIAAGAGGMAVPTEIRESLMRAYQSGEADSSADFLTRAGIVIKGLGDKEVMAATAKAAAVGALTMTAGGFAGRALGEAFLPAAGEALGTVAARTAAEVGTLAIAPAALEGRMPEMRDIGNAAVAIVGLKLAGHAAGKIADIYAKTGIEPEQVVADARTDPKIAEELKAPGTDIPKAYMPAAAAEEARNAFPGEKAQAVLEQPYADIPEARLPYTLNMKYVTGPEGIRALEARMTEVYGTEEKPMSHAETAKLAETTLNDMTGGAKVLSDYEPGSAANSRQLHVRGDMLMQASIEAAAAVKKYNDAKAAGSATDQMKLDALDAINKSAMIQAEFTKGLTESARAVEYAKRFKELRSQGARIGELVDMYGKDPDMLLKMAGEMDTPAGMAKFAKEAAKATKWEMVVEAYKAGLIGPISQMANIIGNVTFAATHDIVDIVAALRPGGEVKMVQPIGRIIGQFQGAYEGLKIAADFIGENWTTPMEGLRKLDTGPATKQEQHRKAIPGDLGVLVRSMSFPWLTAMDGAFRMIAERGEINSWAAGEAAKEGLNPATREFRERMAELAQNVPVEQAVKIAAFGTRAVFQDRLNPWMKDVQGLINRSKVGPLFIPYVQTPTNIFKELARSFPLSAPFVEAWRADFKAGGEARDRAIAEVVVGSSLMGLTAALAFDGERITGYGPPEPEKRSAWLETHQPYSVKINGTYYDYSRIQPIGTLIGLAGDMASIWKHMTPEEQDKVPKMITIAFSQAVTNQVWLKGMIDIMRGVAEADRYGPKIAQNLAAGMMPASGWLGQTAQLMDPYVREVNSIMDAIRNKIPGVREGLEPQVSGLTGEPIKNRERLGVVLPIKKTDEVDDKVLTEAARLGVGIGKAPKNIELPALGDKQLGKVELTPEQRTLFASTSGKVAHTTLGLLVNSPNWENMPDLVKKRIYANVIAESRKSGVRAALPAEQRIAKAREIADKITEQIGQLRAIQ